MIKLMHCDIDDDTTNILANWQVEYASRTAKEECDKYWKNKRNRRDFAPVVTALKTMLDGRDGCMYCEDAEAFQVEHFWPRSIYPELAFAWLNFLYACGQCNIGKSKRFPTIRNGEVNEHRDSSSPDRCERPALINPRYENPLDYFELDIRGGTFRLDIKKDQLTSDERKRAEKTKEYVPFNRDGVVRQRRLAYSDYQNDLRDYLQAMRNGESRNASIKLGHIRQRRQRVVLREMQRQWRMLDELRLLFEAGVELQSPNFPPPPDC